MAQNVFYTGGNSYDSPYTAYHQPYENYYPFASQPPKANGRPLPQPRGQGMPSSQKSSPRENPDQNMQDYRIRNDRMPEDINRSKQARSDWESDNDLSGDEKPKPTGLARIWDKHTDRSSMSGVAYIKSTKNMVVKVIWSILLIVAVGVMCYHLYRLISTFLGYQKQTSVELSFDSLAFPALTLCNVNPFRMSKIDLASDSLRDVVDNINPTEMAKDLTGWSPDFDSIDDYYDEAEEDTVDERKRRRRRRKRQTTSTSAEVRNSNFLDDVDIGINDTRQWQETLDSFYEENDPDSWEAEAKISAFYEVEQTFREEFAWELPQTRAQMGHQISDMLLQCSFAGRQCLARNFTRQLTTEYGNCYTLQYDKFISRKSGPKYGLELKLFLEIDEYVPGIANSRGVQVVVHDRDTQPFPGDEGIAVKAGTETMIGLKMINVSRLGDPWGECTSPEEFKKQYNLKYTRTACQNVCLYRKIVNACNCYDILSEETRKLFKKLRRNVDPCENSTEIRCSERVRNEFDNSNKLCQCHSPCEEVAFRQTVSSREWPGPSFADLLVETVCKNNHPSCDDLRAKDVREKQSNFIRLIIYFEDLNFERLSESPAYAIDQFLSDVGGTIGLYIGLSVLAIFEVINLITDIVIYLCCGCCRNKPSKRR